MKNRKIKNLDDLIEGIKKIVLKNRCSFSDDEKVLLSDCIYSLQKLKELRTGSKINLNLVIQVLEILSRLFLVSEHLKKLF